MTSVINKETRTILLNRSLLTLGIILFIRLGIFIPIPEINHLDLGFYLQTHSITRNVVSTFSGDNIFIIGLFTLNIFPYINASIFMQLLLGISPNLAKLQKEGDFEGRRLINRLTRFITLIWALIQSIGLTLYLKQVLFNWNYTIGFEIIIWLTTGAMIILWLSEIITDYGFGNGASLLIYVNIISSLPNLIKTLIKENPTIVSITLLILLIFISLYGIIFLQEGVRVIPLISSQELNQISVQESKNKKAYLPLRFNQAGVMPIILTTVLLVVPNYINSLDLLPKVNLPINLERLSFLYWIAYFGFILLFSSFYSTIVLNPKDIADQLQKMAVTIPGIRPGIQTTFYLKQVMKRVTSIGAIMLATLTVIPNFLESTLKITSLNGLNVTSLLILVGVVLDLAREVKNIYFSNIYNSMS